MVNRDKHHPFEGVFWSHYAALAALENRAPSAVDLKCWTVSGQPMRLLMTKMTTTTTTKITTSLVLWSWKACPNPHNSWKSCSLISTYTQHKHTIFSKQYNNNTFQLHHTLKKYLSDIVLQYYNIVMKKIQVFLSLYKNKTLTPCMKF